MKTAASGNTNGALCPICRGDNYEFVGSSRGHSRLFQERQLRHCSNCGLMFMYPMPTEDELTTYNSTYFENAHGGLPDKPTSETIAFSSGIARLRLHHIRTFLGRHRVPLRSVLEIGPGPGFFFICLKEQFPEVAYMAVEPDRSCRAHLHEIGARVFDSSEQFDASRDGCDLLVLSHVLEHTPNPAGFLRPLLKLLHPGGVLFIEVPCQDHKHKLETEPHLLFFDKSPMKRLLLNLGMVDLQLSYHGKEIQRLKYEMSLTARAVRKGMRILERIGVRRRVVADFGSIDGISDPAERDAVGAYESHLEKESPSWWLRALARKPSA